MSARLRTILAQIGSFVLAGVLLYLALRGVDFSAVWVALREANYTWLLPLTGIVLLSHFIRAWRWKILLDALPADDSMSKKHPVSVKTAFYSVMIGYMVNYAAPRLGEVARSANLAAREKVSFSSVFGTVVVERIVDVIVLLVALVSVVFLLSDQLVTLQQLFIDPLVGQLGRIPTFALFLLSIAVVVIVLLIYRQALISDSLIQRLWMHKVRPVVVSFKDGLLTVIWSRQRFLLVFTTIFIWFCYTVMAYIPLVMLGMAQTYDLSLLDAWGIMALGAIGVAIPSPGGTGSYHYITIQTMLHLYSVPQEPAATYAVLTHAAQMILYTIVGFISLLLQGSSFRSLKQTTKTAQQDSESVPPETVTGH